MGMSSNQIANRANHTRVSHEFCLYRFEDKCATHEIKKKKKKKKGNIITREIKIARQRVNARLSRN